jgi:hypothetical protein
VCVSLGLKKPGDFTVSEGHGYSLVYKKKPMPPPPYPFNIEKIVLRKKVTPFPSSFHMSNEGGQKKH